MADISEFYSLEDTREQIYEGIYPFVCAQANLINKKITVDEKEVETKAVVLYLETVQPVPFPNGTNDKLVVKSEYSFISKNNYQRNALTGISHAMGIEKFKNTSEFEGKACMLGVLNRTWQDNEGNDRYSVQIANFGFAYAPIPPQGGEIKYVANDLPEATDEEKATWFKNTLSMYKQPK